jgi:uncharacterized protein YchJ
MDTRDGRIYQAEQVQGMDPMDRLYMREMGYHPTPEQRRTGKVGRNDPCPCGSGQKFKKCCLWRVESAKRQRSA